MKNDFEGTQEEKFYQLGAAVLLIVIASLLTFFINSL